MTPRITRLQVSNFRSLYGSVDLVLDAPVVLIHGQNGAGKTSLLSAIELGLTGKIRSLQRYDENYAQNIPHRRADKAKVSIACRHPDVPKAPNDISISEGNISGLPLLTEEFSQFYTERCFLAQTALGRLFELYEGGDARDGDSPLTRFIKDLLGLDALDNLINGLFHLGDVRRMRRALPIYRDVENLIKETQSRVTESESHLKETETLIVDAISRVRVALAQLIIEFDGNTEPVLSRLVVDKVNDDEASRMTELAREIEAAKAIWLRSSASSELSNVSTAEIALVEAQGHLETWTNEEGAALFAVLRRAHEIVSIQPQLDVSKPNEAYEAASARVKDVVQKQIQSRSSDIAFTQQLANTVIELDKAESRAERLADTIDGLAIESGSLAEALSTVSVHISDEVCPVCQRDFTEVSRQPLHAHLSAHIAELTQTAGQLQEAVKERQTNAEVLRRLRSQRERLEQTIMSPDKRSELNASVADLSEIQRQLAQAEELTQGGQRLVDAVQGANAILFSAKRHHENALSTREAIKNFLSSLQLDINFDNQPLTVILDACLAMTRSNLEAAERRAQFRLDASNAISELHDLETEKGKIEADHSLWKIELIRQNEVKASADKLKESAQQLSKKAVMARTETVRKVLSGSLNRIWRDLFVRLAPEEPFIPGFTLPQSDNGPVEAKLEARYFGEDEAGNPKAILSAGNLNTAALTLFMSLNLSVKPTLPWLVIDDPIQSMDEIHIAQFAALLRRLSKQQDRQIIIAVHERPLFEYLALELSPASEGDRLITVELERAANGKTTCTNEIYDWNPETVFSIGHPH